MDSTQNYATETAGRDVEKLKEMTSTITQLLKRLNDKIVTLTSQSLSEIISSAEIHATNAELDEIFGSFRSLFQEVSTACVEVTQEQFDSNRVEIAEIFNVFKGFRAILINLVDNITPVFTNQNNFLTQSAQKSVTEHKFDEVDAFRKAIDLVTVTKANVDTLVRAFMPNLNSFYETIDEIMKSFLKFNLKTFPNATETSQVSRKRWRDDLAMEEEKAGINTHLPSALNLLKCLICDAATNGSKYIVVALEKSVTALSVFYDYRKDWNVLRLDPLWLQYNSNWPQKSEYSVHYLNSIKSMGIDISDVARFYQVWDDDIGCCKIRGELIKLGYKIGSVTLSKPVITSNSGCVDDAAFNKFIGATGGTETYISDAFNKLADGSVAFQPGSLVINLWSDERLFADPIVEILTRGYLYPFFKHQSLEQLFPFFYIKPDMSHYVDVPNRGGLYRKEDTAEDTTHSGYHHNSLVKTVRVIGDAKPVVYRDLRKLVAEGKQDNKIEKFEIIVYDCTFKMGNIQWVELPIVR